MQNSDVPINDKHIVATNLNKLSLPDALLSYIASGISSAIPTDSIYIFGSFARGEETPTSDIDIFVVTSDANERPLQYAAMAAKEVADGIIESGYDYDLLTRPRQSYESRKKKPTSIDGVVSREGVKIYG